jgi:hypothetical protein
MDTTSPPADTQETSEHQRAKCESTASNYSFSHTHTKHTKSHVKVQTNTTTLIFTSENLFSILQTEHDAQASQHQKSQLHDKEKKKFPPIVTTPEIIYLNVLTTLKQVIIADLSTTYTQKEIRFHFSSYWAQLLQTQDNRILHLSNSTE